jgi:integrase
VAKKNNAPSKAELEALAATLEAGKRVKVGTGIYMTKDASGRLRFQWRARLGGRSTRNVGDTCDSYEAAVDARNEFNARKNDSTAKRRERGSKMTIEQAFTDRWWLHVETLEGSTHLDYGSAWDKDIYPYFKGMTLAALLAFDDWEGWDNWLKRRHRKSDGSLANSAIEKAYKIFNTFLNFLVEEELLGYNPLETVQRKRRRRDREARKNASKDESTRAILRSEIPSTRTLELARLWMPGQFPIERQMRRALFTLLIWVGLRPGEALYLRWLHLRDAFGMLDHVAVRGALKDIAGDLQEGDTKTHTERDAITFPFVQAELDALFHAFGAPTLRERVFPNRSGGPMRWDNLRDRGWYPSLFRAGIADNPQPGAVGAFRPYLARHHAASALFHAERPDEQRYSPAQIARSLGNTQQVLHDTYSHVLEDDDVLGVGGRTVEQLALHTRRQVCGGPLPGDRDFKLVEFTTVDASTVTGLTVSSLGDRCRRGTLPSRQVSGRYIVNEWDLVMAGLLDPSRRNLDDTKARAFTVAG